MISMIYVPVFRCGWKTRQWNDERSRTLFEDGGEDLF